MGPRQSDRKELQFVTVSDPTNKDVAQRKLVRKHVMRRYWKGIKDQGNEKAQVKEGVELASALPSDDQPLRPLITSPVCICNGHCYRASKALPTQCPRCGQGVYRDSEGLRLSPQDSSSAPDKLSSLVVGSPYVVFGGGDRDPFQTFPVPAAPYTEFLIRHWITNLTPSICTLDVGTSDFNPVTEFLVPFAISDAALFHSLMCFSSSLVDARVGRDTSGPTTLYHMGNAITMINDALNNTQRAISDEVLATICLVAANNLIFRDCRTHERHADGIDQIVALRGGIQNLHPAVFGLVIWVDQFRGLYTSTLPRYTLSLSPSTPPTITEVLALVEVPPGGGFWSVAVDLNSDCLEMMEDIRTLTHFMDTCKATHPPPYVKGLYYEKRGYVEHRLVVLLAETSVDPATAYEQCCYLAGFLYHNTVLRPVCVWSGVHQAILERLKTALLRTDLGTFWGQDIELLLWILTTAIPSALADPSKLWFVKQLKRVIGAYHSTPDVECAKNTMRRFLWHEKESGPNCEKVYREIVGDQGNLQSQAHVIRGE